VNADGGFVGKPNEAGNFPAQPVPSDLRRAGLLIFGSVKAVELQALVIGHEARSHTSK
jgi:hypothetical protein